MVALNHKLKPMDRTGNGVRQTQLDRYPMQAFCEPQHPSKSRKRYSGIAKLVSVR